MAGDPAQDAAGMIPGVGPVNWLAGLFGQAQRAMTTQPTQRSRSVQAQNDALLRRQRLAAQLQADARAKGRAPLSQNEIDEALHSYGL